MIRAEWQKITGNKLTTALFVWIFPLGVMLFGALTFFILLVSPESRESVRLTGVYTWDESLLLPWFIVNNELVRFVIVAFMAFVFAGEYQHGTWKNLVTHRPRVQLILTKFFVVVLMITFAWVLMTLIHLFINGTVALFMGLDFGTFDGETVENFIRQYALEMLTTMATTFIAAGYAAAAAILVKSVMPAIFIGIILNLAESGVLILAFILDGLMGIRIYGLYQLTPAYNIINIRQWVTNHEGYTLQLGDMESPNVLNAFSMGGSVLLISVWFIVLIGFAVWRFHRQDITT